MIQNIRRSLTDLLGAEYTAAVCRARAALTGESPEALRAVADEKVDFYPEAFARRQEELMGDIGHSLLQTLRTARPPIHTVPPSTALQLRWAGWAHSASARTAACISRAKASITRFPWDTTFQATRLLKTPSVSESPMLRTTTPAALSPARWSAASSPPPTASSPQTRRWTAFCPKRSRAC